jgi:ribose transport system ATP-binding protein
MKKSYGAVRALSDGNLEIRSGEVVALLGANGSGKSTLGKIITGITRPDAGVLLLDGRPVTFRSPQEARRKGVTAVYQELSLVPDLSVAENIWLGHEPLRLGGLDRRVMRQRTEGLLQLFSGVLSVPVTPDLPVRDLPPSERQIVEILKALSREPRVLILDEATASLGSQQVERLFELVGQWRAAGMAIAFVSHRMEEIFRIADRAVVLRNGDTVGERNIADVQEAELVRLMTGDAAPPERFARHARPEGPVLLALQNLQAGRVADVSFDVQQGELVGLGGLQGQGQADLLLAVFGAIAHRGFISLHGQAVNYRSPRQAMRAGIAYVPGDRGAEGLLPIRPILENLQLPGWARYGLPLRMRAAEVDAGSVAADLNIKFAALAEPVQNLSGGNAQKVVIGKWLLRKPQLLLLNDPTKGIDVTAKAEFYALLAQLLEQGSTIILHSSDDDELLGLCQRVIVLHDGRVAAELAGGTLDHQHLLAASMGAASAGAAA